MTPGLGLPGVPAKQLPCSCGLCAHSFCNQNNSANIASCLAGAWGSGTPDNCPNPCSMSGKVLVTIGGLGTCVCSGTSYPTLAGACAACLEGMDCAANFAAAGQQLSGVPLLPGYWRASGTSLDIYKCTIPGACLGVYACTHEITMLVSGGMARDGVGASFLGV